MNTNPRKTKSFPVPEGIIGHGKTFEAIVMREPSFADYMELSDPYLLTFSEGGSPMVINQPSVLQGYIQRCTVEPEYLLVETQAPFTVAREIAAWMMGHFRSGEAEATSATSPTSPKSSSSSSTSTPAP